MDDEGPTAPTAKAPAPKAPLARATAGTTTAVVNVSYHLLPLLEEGVTPEVGLRGGNGLVYVQRGGALVLTGIHTGYVSVSVGVLDGPPHVVDIDGWDEVAEVSIESPGGTLFVTPLLGHRADLPLLTPEGPGSYRLRLHARGRDTSPDGVAYEPFEYYLLLIWPAPTSPPVNYKQSDRLGKQWRENHP